MGSGWRSSPKGSFRRPRSVAARRSGWPKPPIPWARRGTTTTRSSTRHHSAPDSCGFLPVAGCPKSLTKPDGAGQGYAHVLPQALPGGRNVLFTVWGQKQGSAVLSLDSGRWDVVLPVTGFASGMFQATGGSTGRILLVDQTAGIMAAPFDAARPATHQRRCIGSHRRVLRR